MGDEWRKSGTNEHNYLYSSDTVSAIKHLASLRGNMTSPTQNANGLEEHYFGARGLKGSLGICQVIVGMETLL
jgi:hypothetical protein